MDIVNLLILEDLNSLLKTTESSEEEYCLKFIGFIKV